MFPAVWEDEEKDKSQINKIMEGVNKMSVITIIAELAIGPIVVHG